MVIALLAAMGRSRRGGWSTFSAYSLLSVGSLFSVASLLSIGRAKKNAEA